MALLTVHDLTFDYDGTHSVLKNISFAVAGGAICGLLGPNGSGKTTLLKCINGILMPNRGEVCINGRPVAKLSRKTIAGLMAVVPQLTQVAFAFTVLQMVVMARIACLGMFDSPCAADWQAAEAILDKLGLAHLRHRPFNSLSGGEKQMVLLARALFQDPLILLLDEPTAHLDFKNQHLLLDRVQSLTKDKGLTTILTLHDPNLAVRYCSDLVMIKGGRIHRQGTTHAVFDAGVLTSMYGMDLSIETGDRGESFVVPTTAGNTPTLH
ncbi:ABC-type cobalamin/Fe3+-siderophore transport system, ATPase component [Desulfosarcina cetonica]|uniref:ABC transporter ATP-binding protein n=1 Tax=Desulfosarcina cetonica TaxID=90730 RepID=UPI000AF8914E|nr:ABC transporter ATP-binding protein [Desulfosarcina cetonica]VTR68463.1 ABC-type cobalamin/Fe3+-siderophore transport system, ATPase component [Desulfosarcina cetonica]